MGLSSVHAPRASHNCGSVARNFLSARTARAAGFVSPSASAFSMRRALTPRRFETKLDNLICISSSTASSWFCKRTLSRLNWYFRRVTVRHTRCSASGTKLRISSFATSRFTKRSASGKSLLRPRRPRFDCACARWSVPDIGPAPSRFWQLGFQCRSSAPQTGFQYCAVDSITTSSTSCSISHAASNRNCSGLLPYLIRSNWYSPLTSTSATTTASIFLWTSIPAILYDITSPPGGSGERAASSLTRVTGYRRSHRRERQRPIIRSTTHAPDQTVAQPQLLHCVVDLIAPSLPYSAFDSDSFSCDFV